MSGASDEQRAKHGVLTVALVDLGIIILYLVFLVFFTGICSGPIDVSGAHEYTSLYHLMHVALIALVFIVYCSRAWFKSFAIIVALVAVAAIVLDTIVLVVRVTDGAAAMWADVCTIIVTIFSVFLLLFAWLYLIFSLLALPRYGWTDSTTTTTTTTTEPSSVEQEEQEAQALLLDGKQTLIDIDTIGNSRRRAVAAATASSSATSAAHRRMLLKAGASTW